MYQKVYNNIVDQSLFTNGEFYVNLTFIGVYNRVDEFLVKRIGKIPINMNALDLTNKNLLNTMKCVVNPTCSYNNILNIYTYDRPDKSTRTMICVNFNRIKVVRHPPRDNLPLSITTIETYKQHPGSSHIFTLGETTQFEAIQLLMFLSTSDFICIDNVLFNFIVCWFFKRNLDLHSFFDLQEYRISGDTIQLGYNLFRLY